MPRRSPNPVTHIGLLLKDRQLCRRCLTADATVGFLRDQLMFCEPCRVDIARAWGEYWAPAEREATFQRYRSKYGIGAEEYGLLYERQGGCCLICRRFDRPLVVDHCHASGGVRGLLCGQCNTAIGLLGEDEGAARRAASYLQMARPLRESLPTPTG